MRSLSSIIIAVRAHVHRYSKSCSTVVLTVNWGAYYLNEEVDSRTNSYVNEEVDSRTNRCVRCSTDSCVHNFHIPRASYTQSRLR